MRLSVFAALVLFCGRLEASPARELLQSGVTCDVPPQSWSNVDNFCNFPCRAVVVINRVDPRTCEAYCKAQGLPCSEAWDDDKDETCDDERRPVGCSFDFVARGTSDAVCQCGTAGKTEGAIVPPLPTALPTAMPRPIPIATTAPVLPPSPSTTLTTQSRLCDPSQWAFLDKECPTFVCRAVVVIRQIDPRTCTKFCEMQGLLCVEAWDDDADETCNDESRPVGCDYDFFNYEGPSTSDAVCQCREADLPAGATDSPNADIEFSSVNVGGAIDEDDGRFIRTPSLPPVPLLPTLPPVPLLPTLPKPAEAPDDSTSKNGCTNHYPSCDGWAALGECSKNAVMMEADCCLTCRELKDAPNPLTVKALPSSSSSTTSNPASTSSAAIKLPLLVTVGLAVLVAAFGRI